MTSSNPEAAAPSPSRGRPLSPDDFVVLNDEIRAFVRAGIPLDIGLRGTAERTDGVLRELSDRLATRLQQGTSIEDTLAAEGNRLPAEYRAILAAGLRTGRLDDVLASISELTESTTSLKRQIQLSAIYPTIVVILAIGLFGFFTTFIVPLFQRTYELFGIEASAWLRALIWLNGPSVIPGISTALVVMYACLLCGIAVLAVFGYMGFRGSMVGLPRWVPGGRDLSLARFSRVLSLLVKHNVALPEACRLSGQASGDGRIDSAARQLAESVGSGQSLHAALEGNRTLPSFLCWLIVVGERQGSLATSLQQAAAVYEQRALSKLDWFRRVVPTTTLIVCCGTITLFYGLTLFVPFTEMIKKLGVG